MKGPFLRLAPACPLAGLTRPEIVRELGVSPAAVATGGSASK
jgi:hypothetical protein